MGNYDAARGHDGNMPPAPPLAQAGCRFDIWVEKNVAGDSAEDRCFELLAGGWQSTPCKRQPVRSDTPYAAGNWLREIRAAMEAARQNRDVAAAAESAEGVGPVRQGARTPSRRRGATEPF